MLTIHQALAPNQTHGQSKTGLAIAGGGPVGAIYELGALRALDESIDGLSLHELDVYVGVSAGAMIAAGLANRIPTAELCRIFLGQECASLQFEPGRFLRPAFREYLQRAARLPAILKDSLSALLRHPGTVSLSRLVGDLGKAIPSGIFDNENMRDFLQQAFRVTGRSDRFDDLDCQLYVVAVDLDTGAAVRFGSPSHRDVSISKAVQSSAALPGLYPPVEIGGHFYVDGALRRTLHASAALDEGVDLLISINPLVPFNAASDGAEGKIPTRKLIEGGLPLILSQTFRAMIQSRMEAGFKKYHTSHPFADLVLLEPDRSDETIFFTNIFSYTGRKALCEHAYQVTRRDLLARRRSLDRVLASRGLSLNLERLNDSQRTLEDSIRRDARCHSPVARNLSDTLDELEAALSR